MKAVKSSKLRALPSDCRLWGGVAFSVALTLGICYWLMALRANALDITFESIFRGLFIFYDYPLALLSLLVLLLALVRPLQLLAVRFIFWISSNIHVIAAMYFLLLATGALLVYHAHPLSMDEYAAVFQSKIFAAGRLTGEMPIDLLDWLIPRGFQNYFIAVSHLDGRVASSYWPGFALLMAPFSAFGVPWLLNPTLAACGILLLHRLTYVLFQDRWSAGFAVLLAIASPAFTINAISFYSMTAHLVLNCAFLLLLLRGSSTSAFIAGVVGSLALCLHNPVPHALFAAPWLLYMLHKGQFRRLLVLGCGYVPGAALLGIGWSLLVRDIATSNVASSGGPLVTTELSEVFKFPLPWLLYARVIGLAKLWLWAVPASVVLATIGYCRWRHRVEVRLLLASALLTFVGYLFVPFDQGHGWGFRYFHSVWFVIPVLAAAAATYVRKERVSSGAARNDGLAGYGAATAMAALLILVPLSAFQVEEFMSRHLSQVPSVAGAAVVILRADSGYYAYDLVQNDPFLRNPIIMMASRGRKADAQMLSGHFPHLKLLHSDSRAFVWSDSVQAEGGEGATTTRPAVSH